jgi:hypothetical protein
MIFVITEILVESNQYVYLRYKNLFEHGIVILDQVQHNTGLKTGNYIRRINTKYAYEKIEN